MDSIYRFSTKAERYARFRWGYAPEAVQAIFELTGLNSHIAVADIGAGTGLFTKELIGRLNTIVDARAEATILPDQSVDLIAVGRKTVGIHTPPLNPVTGIPMRIFISAMAVIRNIIIRRSGRKAGKFLLEGSFPTRMLPMMPIRLFQGWCLQSGRYLIDFVKMDRSRLWEAPSLFSVIYERIYADVYCDRAPGQPRNG